MRARSLKPSFFSNEDLARLPALGRLLFQGLWCCADREGRLEDRPPRLRAELFPYDPVSVEQVDEWLGLLAGAGMVFRYEAEGRRYLQVTAFGRHQTPHYKERPSEIPAPMIEGSALGFGSTVEASALPDSGIPEPDSRNLTPDPRYPRGGKEKAKQPCSADELEEIVRYWTPRLSAQALAQCLATAGELSKATAAYLNDRVFAEAERKAAIVRPTARPDAEAERLRRSREFHRGRPGSLQIYGDD